MLGDAPTTTEFACLFGLNLASDIAKLMGHANISTSQRYIRNLPVGGGEAVMLKSQRRHNTITVGIPAL